MVRRSIDRAPLRRTTTGESVSVGRRNPDRRRHVTAWDDGIVPGKCTEKEENTTMCRSLHNVFTL